MTVIDDFISRYRREFDFYDQAARLVAQQIEQQLQGSGIRAMVTSRAKNLDRLFQKVQQRDEVHRYVSVGDIYDDIADLAGARISLYFPGERQEVDKIIKSHFDLLAEPKVFSGSSGTPSYGKRFSGYWATHYRIRLRGKSLTEAQERYSDARVEIQVASVLMLAWAEVEHDLIYKPLQGDLSEDEYAILDELNGLVIAGEVALERLQRAAERRVGREGGSFANHYDLAAFLLESARPLLVDPASEAALGRVDILFELLKRLNLATPAQLAPFIDALHADTELRPIAEQIVDQIVSTDYSRYAMYERIKKDRRLRSFYVDEPGFNQEHNAQAIGHFLTQWITVEKFIRILADTLEPEMPKSMLPTIKRLSRMDALSKEVLSEIALFRDLRNKLVHGIEEPDAPYLSEAASRLQDLIEQLANSPDEIVRTAMNQARLNES